ncbi:MAG TPA: hypothetical protein GX506_00875 [Firmicutes bacterium]|nr:hypothetical protein [Bacillota bacterium]
MEVIDGMRREDESYRRSTPDMPDNAEESVKCPQCGNLIGVTDFQAQQSIICPVCGTYTDLRQRRRYWGSNEEY